MGRWTSRDPIADRIGGPNRAYTGAFISRDTGGYNDNGMPNDTWNAAQVGYANPVAKTARIGTGQYRDGYNLYEYVRGNPIIYTDPSGLLIAPIRPPGVPKHCWDIFQACLHEAAERYDKCIEDGHPQKDCEEKWDEEIVDCENGFKNCIEREKRWYHKCEYWCSRFLCTPIQ
jgi:hypothetical protein